MLILTPVFAKIAVATGFTDKVTGDPLKIHGKAVPLSGGIAIAFVTFVALIMTGRTCIISETEIPAITGIIAGGLVVVVIGLIDDIKGLSPGFRFIAETGAGAIAVLSFIKMIPGGMWYIIAAAAILYLVGTINAFNVIDGMDGLCAGTALVSCAGFFVLGIKTGNILLTELAVILIMCLSGFLPYNFHPAKVFLGDSGSGFLGFMLGAMTILAISQPYDLKGFIVPVMIIFVPLADLVIAVLRRLLQGKPLFRGDRDHTYDLLLKKGWRQPAVWGMMCGVQVVLVVAALIMVNR